MPIYEYECECGNHEEQFFHVSDVPETIECPKCNERMKRVISLTSFALKGKGWFKDGYSPAPAKESPRKST